MASGVRRIEATTGKVSLEETRHGRTTLLKAAQFFKTAPGSILERMEQQANEMKELRQAVEKFKAEASLGEAKQVMASAKAVGGLHIITSSRQGLDANVQRAHGGHQQVAGQRGGVVQTDRQVGADAGTDQPGC